MNTALAVRRTSRRRVWARFGRLGFAVVALSVAVASCGGQGRQPASAPTVNSLSMKTCTVNGLAAIGVWPHVSAQATPIRHIHVTRAGEFGSVRMDATRHGVDALGWTRILARGDPLRHATHSLSERVLGSLDF